jgi:hypothetical protein
MSDDNLKAFSDDGKTIRIVLELKEHRVREDDFWRLKDVKATATLPDTDRDDPIAECSAVTSLAALRAAAVAAIDVLEVYYSGDIHTLSDRWDALAGPDVKDDDPTPDLPS